MNSSIVRTKPTVMRVPIRKQLACVRTLPSPFVLHANAGRIASSTQQNGRRGIRIRRTFVSPATFICLRICSCRQNWAVNAFNSS